ncbi:hypothetical protein [uncultured Mailhella sp.]|uniref:hypothetical protein n=1 Tax=uncultured Mailhella sp. TaxID=1981031 RepID=UPI0025F4A611|nr:hypothetical protein [uncultured Mailhella sp.]
MSDFVSVLDIMENAPYGAQTAVQDEIAVMDADLRRAMDRGLTPDDMKKAQAARSAAQAAAVILDKLFV